MQSLDHTIFGPLKPHYNNECDKWMVAHAGQSIGQYDVTGLFGLAYLKSCTMDKTISGFRCTDQWPFNPYVFTDEDFLPSIITDEPESEVSNAKVTFYANLNFCIYFI